MRVMCLLLMLNGFAFGNDLLDKLVTELTEKGETSFSAMQIAFISEGITDQAALDDAVAKWDSFMADLAVGEKDVRKPVKRRWKVIQKNIAKQLKQPNNEYQSLMDLMENGTYNRITASHVFKTIGMAAGMTNADFPAKFIQDQLDAFFFKDGVDEMQWVAAYITYQAYNKGDDEDDAAVALLNAAHMIAPAQNYEPETLGLLLYNRAFDRHDKGNKIEGEDLAAAAQFQLAAARIALPAAKQYPNTKDYHPLAFNIAIKLMTNPIDQEQPDVVDPIVLAIADITGENREQYMSTLANRDYNKAARAYNAKDYATAATILEGIKTPPDPVEYNDILGSSYTILIDDAWKEDKERSERINAWMAKLEKVKPDQFEIMTQRLKQLELVELDKSGRLDEALAKAGENVASEIDQNNYISLLTRGSQGRRESGNFEGSLQLLESAIQGPWIADTLNNLRFNTYIDWLDSVDQDKPDLVIPIYEKMFADKKMTMDDKSRQAVSTNYGNAMTRRIEGVIADRKFKEAKTMSDKALKVLPDHPGLLQQRGLIERILKRIGG